jgi:predicted amidophosphoribosyltransferase
MPPPYAVADYAGPPRSFLLAYKEQGVSRLRDALGHALARAVAAALRGTGTDGGVWLVPVPSTPAALRERGEDVVGLLAREAARHLRAAGSEVAVLPALRHRRSVRDSAALTAGDRAANLAGAFGVTKRARRAVPARPVVLLDDLVTTGATLTECAEAVRAAGGVVRAAAAVAATRRRLSIAREGLHNGSGEV